MPVAPGQPLPPSHVLTLGRDPEEPVFAAPGARVSLPDLAAGGPALLFVYKGDCGASDAAAHVLTRLAALDGLTVAAISQDSPSETEAFSGAHRLAAAGVRMLLDPEPWSASDALGVRLTPTFVLVEDGGRVAEVVEGWSRDEVNHLGARAAALAGVPSAPVSTPADGPAFRPG